MIIILLDNTALSNFAHVERMDLIQKALGARAATTPQVMQEFHTGVDLGRFPAVDMEWLQLLSLTPEEEPFYQRLLGHLNAGESSCLAIAIHRSARVLTDDRDARVFAGRAGIAVSGTLGILAQLTREGLLTVAEADDLLAFMIQKGYRSPVESIKALL